MQAVLFADDTTLLFSHKSFESVKHIAEQNLNLFHRWSIANRLSLNFDKTHAMIISNRKYPLNCNILLNDRALEIKRSCTFLGIVLDDKLKFSAHADFICKKVSKTVGILYRLSSYIPTNILLKLYYSLVYPNLIYCVAVWGGSFQCNVKPLEILQKRIVRIINGAGYLSHTHSLFRKTKLLKFKEIYHYFLCIYMYRNRQSYETIGSHMYSTRNHYNVRTRFQRLSVTQFSIHYNAPLLWNSLPIDLRNLSNILSFKKELKLHLLLRYG